MQEDVKVVSSLKQDGFPSGCFTMMLFQTEQGVVRSMGMRTAHTDRRWSDGTRTAVCA